MKKAPIQIKRPAQVRLIALLLLLAAEGVLVSHTLSGSAVAGAPPAPPAGAIVSESFASLPDNHFSSEGLERPACEDTTFLVVHAAGRYALLYDTAYRQAAWVAYRLTCAEVEAPGVKRAGNFRRDPEVVRHQWPSASDSDYAHSPFDRGHLLPSADRNATTTENRTTFYLSNVSPQYPALNRHIWKHLEEQVRRWAGAYDSLYVVTGPELGPGLPRQGEGGVGVPVHYFKALLVHSSQGWQAVAFRIANTDRIEGHFMDYALSVDSLEGILGYDLFPRLPEPFQRTAEAAWDSAFWK